MMGKILGIDLGTTNSVACYYDNDKPVVILTPEGNRLLPSVVAFTSDGKRLVGAPAKSQLITNPENTIYSIKRFMGKKFSEVEHIINKFTYKIERSDDDGIKIKVNDKYFSPEEISAMILQKIKLSAEDYFNEEIEGVVITVPAYFNDSQRQATKDAGRIADINVLRIINEPTAASLSYSVDLKEEKKIVVYDFGGGTIDISVLEIKDEVIKVLATAGDTNLGGNDFDLLLSDFLVNKIKEEYEIDITDDKPSMQRILEASENAKKELSTLEETEINLPFIANTEEGSVHLMTYITRSEFEALIENYVDRTIDICEDALSKAKITKQEVDDILLVGGSSRIPLVQNKLEEFFNKKPNKKINPDEIVAMGAALQGSIIKGDNKDILLLDVLPLSLGVKTHGGLFTRIIKANTVIPVSRSLVFSTAEDNQSEVEIFIYQGERELAEDNILLGKFTLTGIKPAPKGVPRIEVTFSVNINGILTVSAIDLSTKNKREVVVSNTGRISEEEIERLKSDSEKFKKQDIEKKEIISRRLKILNYIYSIEDALQSINFEFDLKEKYINLIEESSKNLDNLGLEELKELEKTLEFEFNSLKEKISENS